MSSRGAGGTIQSVDDALWWSLATITTVGYGDVVPVTHVGRGVATFLMFLGIGLFGVLTASMAAWFVEQEQRERADITEVMAELRAIRRQIDDEGRRPEAHRDTASDESSDLLEPSQDRRRSGEAVG